MININFGPNIFLSIILLFGIVILYGLRKVKPEVSRDEDLFFVITGFFYCEILMIHGWRLDPILFFSQALLIVSVLFVGWENIRLRGLIFRMRNKNKGL